MECPFCKKEMVKGRISVLDRANYCFYPEEYYGNALKRLAAKIAMDAGIRLDKPKVSGVFGSEIENCFYCKGCKKIIIDMEC